MLAIWITIIWLSAGEPRFATYARPFAPLSSVSRCRDEAAALQSELLKSSGLANTTFVRVICAPEPATRSSA